MNFALSAIIIIILLLPGAFALRAYYTSIKEKKSNIHLTLNDLLLRGLVISFFSHSALICIMVSFGYYVKFDFLYAVLLGKEAKAFDFTNEEFTSNFLQFCSYNCSLLVVITFLTKVFKNIVQSNNLDINYYSLRTTNYWFHIFSARYLEANSIRGEQSKTDLIWVDALFENDVIYSGFLLDFNYSAQKDELENLVLSDAAKIICDHTVQGSQSKKLTSEPSKIQGDIFILPTAKMVNLNVYYLNVDIEYADAENAELSITRDEEASS